MPALHVMDPERWQKIDRLFHSALAHQVGERAAFLSQACPGDEALRSEVESLLGSHDRADSFIEEPATDLAAGLLAGRRSTLSAGQAVGPYKILSLLGEGGMGEVYLAQDMRLGRQVALKRLPAQFTIDPDRVHRFEQEARAVSALNHPNIVTIHEIGESNSLHFITTEFIDGETLRQHLSGAPMNLDEVLDVATQIASALQAAHEAGIVHRDVKPENIMLRRDGLVKVLDFGLAKLEPHQTLVNPQALNGSAVKTNPGVVMGTVHYMSPEQARGAEMDARTDIWSLGVVLYEMVAGRTPFKGETSSHVIVSILESEPRPLSREVEAPVELERIISKALSKERAERYQTAGDMALDLKNLREELTVESRLKRFGRSDADGIETATKSGGHAAHKTAQAPATSTADFAIAHLTFTQYLINGIKRHQVGAVFASVTALLLVASLLYFFNSTNAGGAAIDSVAVLPFANAGGDPESEYLADGISDSVINNLSRLPNLRVISFSTVMRYKGKQPDPQAVGRELNVGAVLMGRLTQQGDSLAISTELVDVKDNRRLWGAQYNGKPSDILAVPEKIAGEIAEKLRLKLGGPDKQRLTKHYTENTEAYEAYARGRVLLQKRTGPTAEKSIEYFEQAIKLDPNYALAYAALADAHLSLGQLGGLRLPAEVMPEAKAAAGKALALDDTLAEAHASLGRIKFFEWDWAGADIEFKRAGELNPNYENNEGFANYLRVMKRFDEGIAESRRILELEPVSVLYNRNVAGSLYYARRYDEAIEQYKRTLELDPNMPTAYRGLAKSYEQKGMYDQAVEAYLKTVEFSNLGAEGAVALRDAYAASGWQGFWRKSLELKKELTKVSPYALAENYARLGEKDQAFAWLEKLYEQHSPALTQLSGDPLWDGLVSDPRYADLVRRMGLEP